MYPKGDRVSGAPTALLLVLGAMLVMGPGCDSSSPTTPSPPGPSCTYQLAPASQTFGPDASTSAITVTTTAQCSWTARVEGSWLSITSGASGTGPGTIALAIAANPDEGARDATVVVADQSLRLTQQGRARCEVSLNPDDLQLGPDGGSRTVNLSTGAGCAWTVVVTESWLSVSPMSGTGSATLTLQVPPYTGIAERRADLRVGDRSVRVDQNGDVSTCSYTVVPTEMTLHWHGAGGEIQLSAQAGCPWTVRAAGDWIDLETASEGFGNTTIRFLTGTFTDDATRKAPVEIRWPTPTAGQNVWISQEGCRYAITTGTAKTYPASGDPEEEAEVIDQPISVNCMQECPWTAVSTVSWIRILSGSPNAGFNRFKYEVLANTTGATRVGTIKVMTQTLTITQLGS
jgi:hypothetical protein